MAHRGNQITKIIFDVGCIISYYNDREAKESNNPYQQEGRITQVIEELKEMNKQSFFDFDTPLQIVKSYEDKVSIMLSKLYDINDFEDLLDEFRWLYFHIQSERWQIDNLQHEADRIAEEDNDSLEYTPEQEQLLAYFGSDDCCLEAFENELRRYHPLKKHHVMNAFAAQAPDIYYTGGFFPKDIANLLSKVSNLEINRQDINSNKALRKLRGLEPIKKKAKK